MPISLLRRVRMTVIGCVIALNALPGTGTCQTAASIDLSGPVRPSSIPAGDIIVVGEDTVVRLAGIDAPEPYDLGWLDAINPSRRQIADAATQFMKDTIRDQEIRIESLPARDAQGLIQAYLFLPDGVCLNERLLSEGLAQVLPGMPDHPRAAAFQVAQSAGQTAKKGIWSVPPESLRIQMGPNDVVVPDANRKAYVNPYATAESTPEERPGRDLSGLIVLGVFALLIGGVVYLIKSLNAIKECPMCQEKMSSRATICPNCKYNEKTGFLGDDELQTWFTKNIRVTGTKKKPKRPAR